MNKVGDTLTSKIGRIYEVENIGLRSNIYKYQDADDAADHLRKYGDYLVYVLKCKSAPEWMTWYIPVKGIDDFLNDQEV